MLDDPMKPKGKHPEKALTDLKVRRISAPGKYADGNGLYLIVDPSSAKRWVLRIMVDGRRRDIGLGGIRTVSLAEAREEAIALKKIAYAGGDPLAARRSAKRKVPTFAEAAIQVHTERKGNWRNRKHAAQWISTLERYVYPHLGSRRIDHIDTPDVLRALAPVWLTKPETARRVKQRMCIVFDWAKAAGYITGENPVQGVMHGLPRQTEKQQHHKALPFDELPAFMATLRELDSNETTKLAFEFLILTAARTREVLEAQWCEIEDDMGVWIVPAERMKAGEEHRIPLGNRAQGILARAKQIGTEGEFIFPGTSSDKPLSNMVFLMALRRMGLDVTAHGFRSSFSDWAAERTHHPREAVEKALAHKVSNRVEAAYRRGDLFEKRRALMRDWEQFCVPTAGEVVTFPLAR